MKFSKRILLSSLKTDYRCCSRIEIGSFTIFKAFKHNFGIENAPYIQIYVGLMLIW